ncbi:MAG: beta-eliminating lyase-related protein, partial [Candidatus Methanoperedens sp.]|nr:beta-eliminating lyase-related protein [Candidatus Methanoperedens sp.]
VSRGRDPKTGENSFPKLELVRVAIPRRVYTNTQMEYVAESIKKVYENRDRIKGLKMVYEPKDLRFFLATFEKVV